MAYTQSILPKHLNTTTSCQSASLETTPVMKGSYIPVKTAGDIPLSNLKWLIVHPCTTVEPKRSHLRPQVGRRKVTYISIVLELKLRLHKR
eukprot:scaffold99651_cov23-Prasinocladus_malaysianus.AAC.3